MKQFIVGLRSACRVCALALMAMLLVASSHAQGAKPPTDPNLFFGFTNVWTLHLKVSADDWKKMQPETPEGFDSPGGPPQPRFRPNGGPRMMRPPGRLKFPTVPALLEYEGKSFGKIGLRFKGNSSYRGSSRSSKRPFKLDFNEYVKGQKFFGLTKLSLNNNIHDFSQMRETLAYQIFREAGVPASRTAYVRLYLTVPGVLENDYLGLYTAVEPVEGPFLKDRFGSKEGLLLKPSIPQGLWYFGDHWQIYSNRFGAKSISDEAEWRWFIDFAWLVDRSDDKTFREKIGSYLELEPFLKFLAAQTATANLDSPLVTGHNYYLYRNTKSGKLVWIPWDLNEAFGKFMMAGSADRQIDLSIDQPYAGENRLIQRLLAIPACKTLYHQHLTVLVKVLRGDKLQADIDTLAKILGPLVAKDPEGNSHLFNRAVFGGNNEDVDKTPPPPPVRNPDFRPPAFGPLRGRNQGPALKKWVVMRGDSIQEQLQGKRDGQPPEWRRPLGGPGDRPFVPSPR